MKVLALDMASRTGWAMQDDNGLVKSGTMDFRVKKTEDDSLRLRLFGDWLLQRIAEGVEMIFFEKVLFTPRFQSGAVLNEFRGVLKYIANKKGVKIYGIPVPTIKKKVAGKGSAKKNRMIAVMSHTYTDQHILDDNQADALGVLWVGCEMFGLPRPRNAEELF